MINFVWMGELNTEIKKFCASLGPLSLSHLAPTTPIYLHLPEILMDDARHLFKDYPNIALRSIERMLNEEYGELKHINKEYQVQIKMLLAQMLTAESYVAQKDLVSVLIMTEYGGYFFDTTIKFIAIPEFRPIEDFKFVLRNRVFYDRPFYGADIWAFGAASPGHFFFTTLIRRVIEGLMSYGEWRDSYTGYVACYFQRTLEEIYAEHELNPLWIEKRIWRYEVNPSNVFIPELQMEKYHTGFWKRPKNVLPNTHSLRNGFKAFNALNLFKLQSLEENLETDISQLKTATHLEMLDTKYEEILKKMLAEKDKYFSFSDFSERLLLKYKEKHEELSRFCAIDCCKR